VLAQHAALGLIPNTEEEKKKSPLKISNLSLYGGNCQALGYKRELQS
jgi:hypothetical protein